MILQNIKWLFFDIGSTLVDETAAYDHRIMDMIAGMDLSFEKVDAKRMELAAQGFDGNSKVISLFGLVKTPWHSEDETLYSGVNDVLEYLQNRGYQLGIIANQAPGVRQRLARWGIADYFGVVASSAELGVAKPDPKIFRLALAMAECEPSQAVMIGDRIDNDVVPAKQYGMWTVWVRSGLSAYQPKDLAGAHADFVIDELTALQALF